MLVRQMLARQMLARDLMQGPRRHAAPSASGVTRDAACPPMENMTLGSKRGAGGPLAGYAPRAAYHRRSVIAAALGNSFEWYDFTIYALFSIYIAKAFFPAGSASLGLVEAFLAFGLGFVIRPLGAVVLGAYGDHAGRKAVLNLSLAIMVLGTGLLAFAPDYAAIGVGAPLLILIARALQGFSAGGEFGGAAAFLAEHAPPGRRGEITSWLQGSMGVSNIIGAVIAFLVTSMFTDSQVGRFAWRIPFLFGLLIAPIGRWMRQTIEETSAFSESQANAAGRGPERRPALAGLRRLLGRHPRAVLRAIGLSTLLTVASYVLVIFMPIYVQKTFHYRPSQAFLASLIGNVLLVASCFAGGSLSDRIGRRPVLMGAGLVLSVCAYPLLALLSRDQGLAALILAQSVFCVATGFFVGTAPAALAETFPVEVRTIGVSVAYNLAVTIFSGFAPAALTWIATHGGGALTPAYYLSFAAAIAAPAIFSAGRPPAEEASA